MSTNDGGPAFPRIDGIEPMDYDSDAKSVVSTSGMSLRDWFAGQALAGMLANADNWFEAEDAVCHAYKHADAMLAARETTNE